MDLRDLKTFLHLAESRHFGRSARAMHVSPSTLSRQIQRLEEDLGQPLFVRDNRKDHPASSCRSLVLGAFALISDGESPPSETPGELRYVIEIPISQSLLRLCAEGSIFDLSAGGPHSQIMLRNSIPPNSPIVLLHLERCSVQGPGQLALPPVWGTIRDHKIEILQSLDSPPTIRRRAPASCLRGRT